MSKLNNKTIKELKQIQYLCEMAVDNIKEIVDLSKKSKLSSYHCSELATFERLTLEIYNRSVKNKNVDRYTQFKEEDTSLYIPKPF